MRVNADWHRHALTVDLLDHWLKVAPTESGFMRTAFERDWKPIADQPGYLTEHARLVFSFTIGYELTKDRRYLDAAMRGADFILKQYRDNVHGGFFHRVSPEGKVIHGVKNLYAHAFALLAMSHIARVTGEDRYRAAALQTWDEINSWMRDEKGGFRGEAQRDFSSLAPGVGSQNPMMHLFEALLALHDATRDPVALAGVKSVGDFVLYRLLKGTPDGGGYIPEWYDENWQPLPTRDKGGYVDLGHQFEWVHLLMAAEKRGLSGVYGQSAERLLKFAVKVGYDETDGGVFTKMYPDGTVDRSKFWWQQVEGMRAFLAVSLATGQSDMWRRHEQTNDLVRDQFVDKRNGGWYAKARGSCGGEGCGGPQVEPYHMVGMHRDALAVKVSTK